MAMVLRVLIGFIVGFVIGMSIGILLGQAPEDDDDNRHLIG